MWRIAGACGEALERVVWVAGRPNTGIRVPLCIAPDRSFTPWDAFSRSFDDLRATAPNSVTFPLNWQRPTRF